MTTIPHPLESQSGSVRTSLPSAIAGTLRSIRRRQAALCLLRAFAVAVAVLLSGMVLSMAIDWWFVLVNRLVRVALTLGTVIGAATAFVLSLRPLWTLLRDRIGSAADADDAVPQLEERWSTVASFANGSQRSLSPTARAMLDQVSSEAVAMRPLVTPSRVVQPGNLKAGLIGCGIGVLVFATFLASNIEQTTVLLKRFLAPTTDITATQISGITGDLTVPRGEMISLVTELTGRQRDVVSLAIHQGDDVVDHFELTADAEASQTFTHAMRAQQSFRYRVRAGDAQTAWHNVTVVDPPEFKSVRVTVTPPEYLGQPTLEKTLLPSRMRVVRGSLLEVALEPSTELESLTIAVGFLAADGAETERIVVLEPNGEGWYRFRMQLLSDVTFRPELVSRYGLHNEDRPVTRIEVIRDDAPVANLLQPTPKKEQTATVDEMLEIPFEAHDDHGIAKAELVIYDETNVKEGEEPKVLAIQEIPLGDQTLARHISATAMLDLKSLELVEGTEIGYAIRVTDNREMLIDPEAEPMASGEGDAEKAEGEKTEEKDSDAANGMTSPDTKTNTKADGSAEKPEEAGSETDAISEPSSEKNQSGSEEQSRNDGEKGESEGSPADTGMPENGMSEDESGADDSPSDMNDDESATAQGSTAATKPEQATNDPEAKPGASAEEAKTKPEPSRGQVERGQDTESQRRRVRITERETSNGEAGDERKGDDEDEEERIAIRERVVAIDTMLERIETELRGIVDQTVAAADRSEKFTELDGELGDVETYIAELRTETKEGEFAFVGLQMMDIARSHVTPARDRVFVAIRNAAGAEENAETALGHIVRARELLAALLTRYERVARDRELATELEESVKIYEVYVEKMQRLLRERRQNQNPLRREMAVQEYDQAYLDRYAEVMTLRREMLSEFGRMLADDPRLLARYMDATKRRRKSLRDQLSDVAERQDEIAYELAGWNAADEATRVDVWTIVIEMRLLTADDLAKDAAVVAERIEKQLPLTLEPDRGTSARIIAMAREVTKGARAVSLNADSLLDPEPTGDELREVHDRAGRLSRSLVELEAAFDRLIFENEDDEDIIDYANSRLVELRTVSDRATRWSSIVTAIREQSYGHLGLIEQEQLAVTTELLRLDMLELESDLSDEFNRVGADALPGAIVDLIRQLHGVMEAATLQQASASFGLQRGNLERSEEQQMRALENLDLAQKLFDRIRRSVVAELDSYELDDPDINQLRDPTLDEFLARLEREPNIQAQLGIPNRPRNLRVSSDNAEDTIDTGVLLIEAAEEARTRARDSERPRKGETEREQMTEREEQERNEAAAMQRQLEEALTKLQERLSDPEATAAEKRRLEKMANTLQKMLDDAEGQERSLQQWERIARDEQSAAMLKAIAEGKPIPDEQWNKLLSTLEDGLWQVRGKQPPEEYRDAIEQYQDRLRDVLSPVAPVEE